MAFEQLGSAANGLGYVGAGLIALAYLLNQRRVLNAESWRFPAINLLGSVLVGFSLFYEPNLPSIVIEAFWSVISVYGIWKNLRSGERQGLA